MGLLSVHSTLIIMKTFIALSAFVAVAFTAPTPDADAQHIFGAHAGLAGYAGLGLGHFGYGANVAYASPAPHVAYAAPVAHVAYAAPAVAIQPIHQVFNHVVTAPVVRHVGTQVHHQVHYVPSVSVDTKTSTHVTHHVIHHAPVIGGFIAPGAAAPAVTLVEEVAVVAAPIEEVAVVAAPIDEVAVVA